MARRKNQSLFEDLIDVVALLPWWFGVGVAIISYFWLHRIAEAPIVVSAQPGQIPVSMLPAMYKGLATAGQFVLPMICIAGAVLSILGRRKRSQLFSNVRASQTVAALNDMSWQEFELVVGEAFRSKGYAVSEMGGGGADGGIDLVLHKNGEKYLVQCKQWRAYKVGVQIVRELYGVMAASGAVGGFVVTSGAFTQEAKDFAAGRNVDLIGGADLMSLIQEGQAAPNCPKCGKSMVKRTAKQGASAGSVFWGCSNFPQCKGSISLK